MSTNSVAGYVDDKGDFRGTYIHWGGDTVGEQLRDIFGLNREAFIEWVERGIEGGGYSSVVDDGTYEEDPYLWTMDKAQEARFIEYVWEVLEDGSIASRKSR